MDWEHLPHVHSQAYSAIRLLESSEKGWRARVEGPGGRGQTSEVQVTVDREALRYVNRTLIGAGAGTEVVTQLSAQGEHKTDIHVEFFLPPVEPQWMAKVVEAYRSLQQQMWDQDEAMMLRRRQVQEHAMARAREAAFPWARASAGTGRQCLGSRADVEGRLPLDVEFGGRPVRIVSVDGDLVAFDPQCPHKGGPLVEHSGSACEARCRWHGYRFDLRSGAASDGNGHTLEPPPVLEIEPETTLVYVSSHVRG